MDEGGLCRDGGESTHVPKRIGVLEIEIRALIFAPHGDDLVPALAGRVPLDVFIAVRSTDGGIETLARVRVWPAWCLRPEAPRDNAAVHAETLTVVPFDLRRRVGRE